jgi:hypothetical protein
MQDVAHVRLNDSGEEGLTRIIRGGAIHYSRGQRTTYHSNYAWKIHVGVDAPVWLKDSSGLVDATVGARVVVSPPGVAHSTGALGLSCAIFVAPGQRSTPWRASSGAFVIGGVAAKRIVEACQRFEPEARADTADFVAEVTGMAAESFGVRQKISRPSGVSNFHRIRFAASLHLLGRRLGGGPSGCLMIVS